MNRTPLRGYKEMKHEYLKSRFFRFGKCISYNVHKHLKASQKLKYISNYRPVHFCDADF